MHFCSYRDTSDHLVYLIYCLAGTVLFLLSVSCSSAKVLHSMFSYIQSTIEFLRNFGLTFFRNKILTVLCI